MARQEQQPTPEIKRKKDDAVSDDTVTAAGGLATEAAARGEALKGEIDDLLDEIDEVLEINSEEFVRQYVQKGGE